MERTIQPATYEQTLLAIIRTLPAERVLQILDYARYIQSQVSEDFDLLEADETEGEILADEALWDEQFAATQEGLKKMAERVRAEIRAGNTQKMVFTKDGRIEPK